MNKTTIASYVAETPAANTSKVVFLDFDICDHTLELYKTQLTDNERQRLCNITLDTRQRQFIITRVVTRQIIADSISCKTSDIEFKLHKHGKPYCSNPDNSAFFNLSHSSTIGVIAINLNQEIGVDVQLHRPQKKILSLAKRFFSEAEIQLLDTTPQEELNKTFFHIWVRKEALLKATGSGLAHGLSQYAVVGDGLTENRCTVKCENVDYFINDIPAPQYNSSAIATQNIDCDFFISQWQHPQ